MLRFSALFGATPGAALNIGIGSGSSESAAGHRAGQVLFATVGAGHHPPDIEPRKWLWTFSHTVQPMPGWSIGAGPCSTRLGNHKFVPHTEQPHDARCSWQSALPVLASGFASCRGKPTHLRSAPSSANYAEPSGRWWWSNAVVGGAPTRPG